MRLVLLALMILQASAGWTQTPLVDRQGTIHFRASKETFVPVKAENHQASAILDLESGALASLVLVKEFKFKNALMQEHFNENYMDSDRYPKITFEGSIKDFDAEALSESPIDYIVKGEIYLHGIRKEISVPLEASKRHSILLITSEFSLKPEDFNIKIPKIVRYKIAKEVIITLEFNFQTP